jgi:hypothetical protein
VRRAKLIALVGAPLLSMSATGGCLLGDKAIGLEAAEADAGETGTASSCESGVAALQAAISEGGSPACAVALRLDASELAVLGWRLICGSASSLGSDEALAMSGLDAPALLSPAGEDRRFVYWQPPEPGAPGGVGYYSNSVGALVLAASLELEGQGSIEGQWRDGAELGEGCEDEPLAAGPSWDLLADAASSDAATLDAVMQALADTGLVRVVEASPSAFAPELIEYSPDLAEDGLEYLVLVELQ